MRLLIMLIFITYLCYTCLYMRPALSAMPKHTGNSWILKVFTISYLHSKKKKMFTS